MENDGIEILASTWNRRFFGAGENFDENLSFLKKSKCRSSIRFFAASDQTFVHPLKKLLLSKFGIWTTLKLFCRQQFLSDPSSGFYLSFVVSSEVSQNFATTLWPPQNEDKYNLDNQASVTNWVEEDLGSKPSLKRFFSSKLVLAYSVKGPERRIEHNSTSA